MDTTNPQPNPHDIFLWPDDFWCYRDERQLYLLRMDNYRIISEDDAEWSLLTTQAYGGFSPSLIDSVEGAIEEIAAAQERLARLADRARNFKIQLLSREKEKRS